MSSSIKDKMHDRTEGMAMALKIAREGGIEALEKEVQYRGISGVSLNLTQKEIHDASWKVSVRATEVAIAISLITLIGDEFCFSRSQLTRFKNAFDTRVREAVNSEHSVDVLREYTDKIMEYADIEITIKD